VIGRNLLALAFRVIALVFGVIAIATGVYSLLFVTRSDQIPGTVVGYTTVQNRITVMPDSDQSGILYYPVVSYSALGTTRELTGPRGTSAPRFEVGEEVTLIVSQSNPADARLATVFGVWGTSIILGAVAFAFLIIGLLTPKGFGGLAQDS
jgi:hypothetical protein